MGIDRIHIKGFRNFDNEEITFQAKTLDEFPGRHYIKRLNMQYVDTNRDLFSFLKLERNQMLTLAKDKRTAEMEINL